LFGNEKCEDSDLVSFTKDGDFVNFIMLFFEGIKIYITKVDKKDVESLFFILVKDIFELTRIINILILFKIF
jgi:hypothetical protein